jgi:hypothetical protein
MFKDLVSVIPSREQISLEEVSAVVRKMRSIICPSWFQCEKWPHLLNQSRDHREKVPSLF